MTSPFERAVIATATDEPGRYLGEIDASWSLRPLPQGGIVSALAARTMAVELGRAEQRLRTLHTTFVAPVAEGPVLVDV